MICGCSCSCNGAAIENGNSAALRIKAFIKFIHFYQFSIIHKKSDFFWLSTFYAYIRPSIIKICIRIHWLMMLICTKKLTQILIVRSYKKWIAHTDICQSSLQLRNASLQMSSREFVHCTELSMHTKVWIKQCIFSKHGARNMHTYTGKLNHKNHCPRTKKTHIHGSNSNNGTQIDFEINAKLNKINQKQAKKSTSNPFDFLLSHTQSCSLVQVWFFFLFAWEFFVRQKNFKAT